MAKIIPFKAVRPALDKAHLVASRPYASYSKEERMYQLENNPYTFLHVLRPEKPPHYSDTEKLTAHQWKIKEKFEEFLQRKILVQDELSSYYVYRQISNNFIHTGIVGCISIEDYYSGVIKKHEATLSEREEKLKHYLEIVDINAEPVCFAYPDHMVLDGIIDSVTSAAPEFDFTTTNMARHQLWVIKDPHQIDQISESFEEIPAVYIADGHHRTASSCLLGKEKKNGASTHENSNYFMGLFIPESQLRILNFNRVVSGLNELSVPQLLELLKEKFTINPKGQEIYEAKDVNHFSMYLDNNWYELKLKEDVDLTDDPVKHLDPSILSDLILSPLLGIKDIRNDKRIQFVGGLEGMSKLKSMVDSGKMSVAFGLHPITMDQLKEVSDQGKVMPPKSTWIEPKLRSGLTIYSLSK